MSGISRAGPLHGHQLSTTKASFTCPVRRLLVPLALSTIGPWVEPTLLQSLFPDQHTWPLRLQNVANTTSDKECVGDEPATPPLTVPRVKLIEFYAIEKT